MKTKTMTIALCATLLAGCQNEDTACLNGAETMVRICTTVVTPHTRTATSPYVGSDLSLSIISANDNFTYTNIKWQSSSDAVSSGWSPATPMRWENATNPVSLYAYAPHSSAVSDITAIPFSVAADQATEGIVPSDLLGFSINSFVPARGEGGLNAEGELPIVLQHRLSQFSLRLRMNNEWEGTSEAVARVEVLGTVTSGVYNAQTMSTTLSADAGAQSVSMYPLLTTTSSISGSYTSILLPQVVASGNLQVHITLTGGKTYLYQLPSSHQFVANTAYTLALVLGHDKVELAGDIQITDWEDDVLMLPDGEQGDTEFIIYEFEGDMTSFPTDPSEIPYDIWRITPSTVDASLDNVKTALTALNGTSRRIALVINGVETVAEDAFAYCSVLSSVTLPSATSIGDYAFRNCSALSSVSLPSATSIGGDAFSQCSVLSSVSLPSATSIGNYAFWNCSALSSVSLPSATSIGGDAFRNCSALSSVSLPSATSIGSSAFYKCIALSSVSLPSATSIGGYAFYYCSSLSSVSLPSATSIGNNAFLNCIALSSVSLPSATSIQDFAFFQCSVLSSVSLPSATSIGDNAFAYCSVLSSVSLPSATSIGNNAFSQCSTLKTLHVATNAGVTVGTLGYDFGYGFLPRNADLTIGRSEATASGATEEGKAWRGYTFKSITIVD